MSKTLLKTRTAFVVFVVLLQLMMQPATQVLHLGCHQAAVRVDDSNTSILSAVKGAWDWCWTPHCCSHCVHHNADASHAAGEDLPAPSHDEDECRICQAVFAARIVAGDACVLPSSEHVCQYEAAVMQPPSEAPRYSVLSRGPPALAT